MLAVDAELTTGGLGGPLMIESLANHAYNQHASPNKEANGKDSTFSSDWWT